MAKKNKKEKTVKRELYSFSVELEEEVEKEITKEVKRKNKETGKMETIEQVSTKTVIQQTPVRVFLRKPTRTQVEDGDMFYSIWLNKFIKMGLLTRAMLAKKQVDLGGVLNDNDKMNYAKLYLQLFEKQQNVIRYSAKDPDNLSNDEKERLQSAISSLAIIRKQLADFEAAQASVFDHTADVKARNKTITWFLLHLATYIKGDDDENADSFPLFSGTDFDERYLSYQDADEEQDPLFVKTIDRLSTIATIWYMSGVQDQQEFEDILKQMNQEEASAEDVIPSGTAEGDQEDDEEEADEEEAAEEEVEAPKKKTRAKKKEAPVDDG
jgi:hypothetical protein